MTYHQGNVMVWRHEVRNLRSSSVGVFLALLGSVFIMSASWLCKCFLTILKLVNSEQICCQITKLSLLSDHEPLKKEKLEEINFISTSSFK